jgi:hypothetical protein
MKKAHIHLQGFFIVTGLQGDQGLLRIHAQLALHILLRFWLCFGCITDDSKIINFFQKSKKIFKKCKKLVANL